MDANLQRICERYLENKEMLRDVNRTADSRILAVCAITLLQNGYADAGLLEESRRILQDETSVFSAFRGNTKLPSITLLAISGHPETRMDQVQETYRTLRDRFRSSEYLALAAFVMSGLADAWQMEELTSRGRTLYKRMRAGHPFLTSSEDNIFALLLSLSTRSDDALITEMEQCYRHLHGLFPAGDGLQSLTHVLTIADGAWPEKCERTEQLYEQLRRGGRKYSHSHELSTLGAAAVLPLDVSEIAAEILEVDAWLIGKKGYGALGYDRRTRLMHAAMLVTAAHTEYSAGAFAADTATTAALSGTVAMVAAQEAALCAVIAANAAAASAATY